MRRIITLFLLASFLMGCGPASSSPEPATVSRTYVASDAVILNPERGFFTPYELPGSAGFSPVRATGNTLVHLNIRLDDWRETDIPKDALDDWQTNFDDIRDAGIKAIIPFAYNQGPYPDTEPDASKSQMAMFQAGSVQAGAVEREVARVVSFGGSCVRCEFSGRKLTGATFIGANFVNASLVGADLRGSELMGSNFSRSDFTRADLSGAEVTGAVFGDAVFASAKLDGVEGQGVMLRRANLTGARLVDAELAGAELSDANLTRADGEEFLDLAARIPLATHVEVYALDRANEALAAVREGRVNGAAVLDCR